MAFKMKADKKGPMYKNFGIGSPMKASSFKKADDNLKNIDISDMSFDALSSMRSQISKDKDPNDYKKITNAMLDQRNTANDTNPELAKTTKIFPNE